MERNQTVRKTGLFGGTFAPPHLGHLHAAKTFLREVELDELIIMPTYIPPHKQKSGGDTPKLRHKMCEKLFGELPKTLVSDYEIKKEGVSYTVDTLEYLHLSCEREIYLLCGTDMFLTLDTWRRAEDIFRLCEVVCMPRFDHSLRDVFAKRDEYLEKFGKDAILLSEDPFILSSTEIREKIRLRKDLSDFLSQDVIEIIKNEGLYL